MMVLNTACAQTQRQNNKADTPMVPVKILPKQPGTHNNMPVVKPDTKNVDMDMPVIKPDSSRAIPK